MQQQKIINKILKTIEKKQNNREYGTITISFQAGLINDVHNNTSEKIKADKEEANEYKKHISE